MCPHPIEITSVDSIKHYDKKPNLNDDAVELDAAGVVIFPPSQLGHNRFKGRSPSTSTNPQWFWKTGSLLIDLHQASQRYEMTKGSNSHHGTTTSSGSG